jgi:chromosome segregation ATPase
LVEEKLALKDSEIRQLQEELISIRGKGDERVRHALDALHKLHEENDRLQNDVDRLRAEGTRVAGAAQTLGQLREENQEFKTQLEVAARSRKGFQEQIEALRREFEGQLARARETVARLEKERGGEGSSPREGLGPDTSMDRLREEYQRQADDLRREIDDLRQDNAALQAAQVAQQGQVLSEERLRDLEQANLSLQDKNKFLQYELTKSRAQASGFERICEGSKKRLEDMAGDFRSLEQEKEAFRLKLDECEKSLAALKRNQPGGDRSSG